MRFEGRVDIGASRDRVWAFVTDAQKVCRCGPDVERVDVLDPTHVKVVARAGIGPIRSTFAFEVEFTELRAPEFATVRARGQAPGSAVEMTNTLQLQDTPPNGTSLRWTSDVTVSGRLASVGSRFMQLAADKVTRQVFACIEQQLTQQRDRAGHVAPPT